MGGAYSSIAFPSLAPNSRVPPLHSLSILQSRPLSSLLSFQDRLSLFQIYKLTMPKGATKKGGVKKGKDPNAPKRAMSAFFFWMKENRDKLKKPGMGVADVAKAAGVEWGKLGDKSKWEKLAEKDKKRYETEITAYKKQ